MEAAGVLRLLASPGDNWLMDLLGVGRQGHRPAGDIFRLGPESYVRTWIVNSPGELIVMLAAVGYLIIIYCGVIVWFGKSIRAGGFHMMDCFLWATALYVIIFSAGPTADARTRTTIMPILALYSARGLVYVCDGLRAVIRRRKPALRMDTA
jgi:hypothetical protein